MLSSSCIQSETLQDSADFTESRLALAITTVCWQICTKKKKIVEEFSLKWRYDDEGWIEYECQGYWDCIVWEDEQIETFLSVRFWLANKASLVSSSFILFTFTELELVQIQNLDWTCTGERSLTYFILMYLCTRKKRRGRLPLLCRVNSSTPISEIIPAL